MDALPLQLWPHHLKPQSNELLSSWMIRLAHAHGYKTERMSRILFGRDHALWGKDIDKLGSPAVLATLCTVTGTSIEQARQTSLQRYEGFLSEAVYPGGYSPWVIPLHIHHRKRTAPGLMYCPLCLQQDDVAFFRRHWRLAFVTVCTQHGIELRDSCPHCGHPVVPHRVDIGKLGATPTDRAFTRCWQCHAFLSAVEPTANEASQGQFTAHLEEVLARGYVDATPLHGTHSIAYFAGLRILTRLAQQELLARGARATAIECLDVARRRAIMRKVCDLLTDWPHRFLRCMLETHINYCNIAGPRGVLPFWLEQVVAPLQRHQHPARGAAELADIARVISNQTGSFRPSVATRHYGVNADTERYPLAYRTQVSQDTHVNLIVSLEHAVAGTFDAYKRYAWLQDQVMFNLYRFTVLTCTEICAMSVSAFDSQTPLDFEKDVWWTIPANEAEALAALQRFIHGARQHAPRPFTGQQVFFSAFTGRPLQASALQARFHQATVYARLTAPIPHMRAYKIGQH